MEENPFIITILMLIVFLIVGLMGYIYGIGETYNDLQKVAINIKCGKYDEKTGNFKFINLLDNNKTMNIKK
jgi:hypothetical protein